MKYLFDTNIIINLLRGKSLIDDESISSGSAISIITYGELLFGAYKSLNKEKSLYLLNSFIKEFSVEILNLDEKIMAKFAEIKLLLEKKGQKLEDFDILIGATAQTWSLTLKTENIKHFQRIPGLKLT